MFCMPSIAGSTIPMPPGRWLDSRLPMTCSSTAAMTTPNPNLASPYGTPPPTCAPALRKPISLPRLLEMYARSEKIAVLTAYDATFAAVADAAGVECILVGDSLGMVCQGLSSTVGVSLESMRYHVESVARGLRRAQATAWLIGDLPFGAYHESKEQALHSPAAPARSGPPVPDVAGG